MSASTPQAQKEDMPVLKAIVEHISSQTATIAAALAAVAALIKIGGTPAAGASPMPVPSN